MGHGKTHTLPHHIKKTKWNFFWYLQYGVFWNIIVNIWMRANFDIKLIDVPDQMKAMSYNINNRNFFKFKTLT